MTAPAPDDLVERAFDSRGYVTLRRRDGSELVGYVYDRGPTHLDIFDESATGRLRIARDEIVDIRFTGDDPVRRSQEIWERRKGALEPRLSPAYGQWGQSRPVLLIVAVAQELRWTARALGLRRRRAVARGRVFEARGAEGVEFVAHAVGPGGGAARVVADEEPRLVVSCGFCGALDPRLEPGDLVLATSVRDEGGDWLGASAALLSAARRALSPLPVYEGAVLCTTAVAATPAEKRALAAPGTLAVDMETHPVARAAAQARIPWLSVRAVVDSLTEGLPGFVREPRQGYAVPALRHALSARRGALEVARLAAHAWRAGRSLEEAIRRLGPALAQEASSQEARP